jgi:ELWxxDGT repeat protein
MQPMLSTRSYVSRWLLMLALAPAWLAASAAFAGQLQLVSDVNATVPNEGSNPRAVGEIGGWKLFQAASGLWRTDGTPANTIRLHRSFEFRISGQAVVVGAVAYFTARDREHGFGLWKTDGTVAGTQRIQALALVVDNFSSDPEVVAGLGSRVVFNGNEIRPNPFVPSHIGPEPTLFIYDPASGTTTKLANDTARTPVLPLTNGNKLYYAGNSDNEPWVTDGTAAGTHRIADINPGLPASIPSNFIAQGDRVLFTAATADGRRRLWIVDTATDDLSEAVFPDGATDYEIPTGELTHWQDTVLFVRVKRSLPTATAVWRTDGTPAGTTVVDLSPSTPEINPFEFAVLGSWLLFPANGSLWTTDGAGPPTALTAPGADDPSFAGSAAGNAYFEVPGASSSDVSLVQTDGTPGGTSTIAGVDESNFGAVSGVPGAVFMTHRRPSGPGIPPPIPGPSIPPPSVYDLWRIDPATSTATLAVSELTNPNFALGLVGQKRLFSLESSSTGLEPWVTDGTPAGTQLLVDAQPADHTASSEPRSLTGFDGRVWFVANDGVHASALWRSDGTPAGTDLAAQVPQQAVAVTGPAGGPGIAAYRDSIWFATIGGLDPTQFWELPRTGSLQTATRQQYSLAATHVSVRNETFFTVTGTSTNWVLWKSATGSTTDATTVFAPPGSFSAQQLFATSQSLYFTSPQRSLFVSDGTQQGTQQVQVPNAPVAEIGFPVVTRGSEVYFSTSIPKAIWRHSGNGATAERVSPEHFDGSVGQIVPTSGGTFLLTSVGNAPPGPNGIFLWFYPAAGGTTDPLREHRVAATSFGGGLLALASGTRALFHGSDDTSFQIWTTDGSNAGTQKVYDLPRSQYASIGPLFDFNGRATFLATTHDGRLQVWSTDGTAAATLLRGEVEARGSSEIAIAGHRLFLTANAEATGVELYSIENDAPVASANDGGSVAAGQSISIDVLANDQDPDGRVVSARIIVQPSLGLASVDAAGRIVYVARSTSSGDDTLTYAAIDDQGRLSNTVAVSVRVLPTASNPGGGSSGGGGGGAMSLSELALVFLLALLASRWLPCARLPALLPTRRRAACA